MKRPSLAEGKSKPWWVLLYEYEDYVRFLEKLLKKHKVQVPDVET